nr:hypothetical protein [Tanacetum cinerariifolium]
MVRNPCMWLAPMNKMAGTPLGEMADQTLMGSVHNSDHGDFASGYSYGGSLKVSDASALVSPTPIINMSRAGNHEELLSGMTNNMCEAAMDAIVLIPIIVVTPVVPAPIVEMTNDGFQTVGKKKKCKSNSINGGQIGGHLVKQNVRYEPKATTINMCYLCQM